MAEVVVQPTIGEGTGPAQLQVPSNQELVVQHYDQDRRAVFRRCSILTDEYHSLATIVVQSRSLHVHEGLDGRLAGKADCTVFPKMPRSQAVGVLLEIVEEGSSRDVSSSPG